MCERATTYSSHPAMSANVRRKNGFNCSTANDAAITFAIGLTNREHAAAIFDLRVLSFLDSRDFERGAGVLS